MPAEFDERAALFDIRRRSLDAPDTLLLTLVQVTVDGLPELHDTRRVLVGGQGTWRAW